jgi:hypothetical protein
MLRRKLVMYVGDEYSQGYVKFVGPTGESFDIGPEFEPPVEAAWNIPAYAAHAIVGALSRELGLTEGAKFQRADFEHERGRVDRLIEAVLNPVREVSL